VGVLGSLVWDEIHGRDPSTPVVEEWGGIAYALAGLDAHLPAEWEIVPLVKVGSDLAEEANAFLGSLSRLTPGGRGIEVAVPNNRVVIHYQSSERRCERMSGGVPAWNWAELGPMVADLDALYVNFLSGYEMCLGTAMALRQGFRGPIYADLHSLLLGMRGDGIRVLQPLPNAESWFGCFDLIQVNEDEMNQLGPDPLSLATAMLGVGVSALIVTLGPRGAVYVAAPGFERLAELHREGSRVLAPGTHTKPVSTALIPAERVDEATDPTGCGDVFGAAVFACLLAGESLERAVATGHRAGARNVTFRGATGLSRHLRGELVAP
ncbi:MAG: carbohydrate kinase family protein, partial [Gemmatimonadales bacterium]|nr:carbohydrate kinase family protein [Gemmatimonadales bacterium]